MPFVRRDSAFDGEIDPYQIYEQTSAVDYNGQEFRRAASASIRHRADPIEEETTIPSHVLTLANTAGGRDGHYIFLDTERGTITICDFQIGPKYTDLSQDIDEDSKETWREYATYRVGDFFEMLKEQYRSLEAIPTEATDVRLVRQCSGFDMDRLKEIYHAHGWPSSDFRKQECMKAVKQAWEEIFC